VQLVRLSGRALRGRIWLLGWHKGRVEVWVRGAWVIGYVVLIEILGMMHWAHLSC